MALLCTGVLSTLAVRPVQVPVVNRQLTVTFGHTATSAKGAVDNQCVQNTKGELLARVIVVTSFYDFICCKAA